MPNSLPEKPSLDYLKREAKRIVRAFRSHSITDSEIALLKYIKKYQDVEIETITTAITLVEIQHALAREFGYASWRELKNHIESQTPVLQPLRPSVKVGDYQQAVEHYVNWLGFNLDWDWREAPGQPTIAAVSRDDVSFFLNESPASLGPISIHLNVKNLEALVAEWNTRRPGAAKILIGQPYEFPVVTIVDPWGNVFDFEGQNEATEQQRRNKVFPIMKQYIQDQLDAGRGFPTPEEVRDVVGPPLGVAIEALNEFEGYQEAFEQQQAKKEN